MSTDMLDSSRILLDILSLFPVPPNQLHTPACRQKRYTRTITSTCVGQINFFLFFFVYIVVVLRGHVYGRLAVELPWTGGDETETVVA